LLREDRDQLAVAHDTERERHVAVGRESIT
jgi:hypothetical protein